MKTRAILIREQTEVNACMLIEENLKLIKQAIINNESKYSKPSKKFIKHLNESIEDIKQGRIVRVI